MASAFITRLHYTLAMLLLRYEVRGQTNWQGFCFIPLVISDSLRFEIRLSFRNESSCCFFSDNGFPVHNIDYFIILKRCNYLIRKLMK